MSNVFCREYSFDEVVPLEKAMDVICYPPTYAINCSARVEELRNLGIETLISFGKTFIGGMKVVGKGHAAIVVLAKHRDLGVVALKIRRMDSKRLSIAHEGELLEKAHEFGVAPKVYSYTDNVIVREFVDGPILRDFMSRYIDDVEKLRRVTASLIEASYALDRAGIELEEISIPLSQTVVPCEDPRKVVFIDFESGRKSRNPTNVTSVLGFIIGRNILGKPFRERIALTEEVVRKLRELAHRYKRVDWDERKGIVDEMVSLILQSS